MAKTMCIQNFTYGATGETFESGVEYDVPAATLKANPAYFKQAVERRIRWPRPPRTSRHLRS